MVSYGGYDGMSGTGVEGGMLDGIKSVLATFPTWLSTLIIAVVILGLAALVGMIIGKIVGNILYPDPEKQSILSRRQKLVCLGMLVAAFAVAIFALVYEPQPQMGEELPVDGEISSDSALSDGEETTDGSVAVPAVGTIAFFPSVR